MAWDDIFNGNLNLMKKGLYNENAADYFYAFGVEPADASANGQAGCTNLTTGIDQPLVIDGNYVKLVGNSSTADLGINNNEYNLSTPFYFYASSSYITLMGTNAYAKVSFTPNVSLQAGYMYFIRSEGDAYIYYAEVASITFESPNSKIHLTTKALFVAGSPQPNIYVAGPSTNYLYCGTTEYQNYNIYQDNADDHIYVVEGIDISTVTSAIIWTDAPITNFSTYTTPLHYNQNMYTGSVVMTVNILDAPYVIPILYSEAAVAADENRYNLTQSTNSFALSTTAVFVSNFQPPDVPLNSVTYDYLDTLVTKKNYLPSILNAADLYLIDITPSSYSIKWPSITSAVYGSDQCRQPWRLANYIRAASRGSFEADPAIVRVAWNAGMAMVYCANHDSLGRLILGINVYTLTCDNYNSYSGDMIPPLIALLDALIVMPTSLFASVPTDYAAVILIFQTYVALLKSSQGAVTNGNFYPLFDSYTSGAQQLGLAISSFVATYPFFIDPDSPIYQYDVLASATTTSASIQDQYTFPFNSADFENQKAKCEELMFRGVDNKNLSDWANDYYPELPTNMYFNYARALIQRAYLTNIRIRGINVGLDDELSFGNNDQTSLNAPSGVSFHIDADSYNTDVYSSTYAPTYFPILSIPDRGWGAPTLEIMSYMGIAFVGMDDYPNFCAWHRMIYFLLFTQNGGSMFNWQTSGDPIVDCAGTAASTAYWLPDFLKDSNADETFYAGKAEKIRGFDIYGWPGENFNWGFEADLVSSVTPINPKVSADFKSNWWCNRHDPYRGQGKPSNQRFCWSTPSYSVGYSPVWVAGGKTNRSYVEGEQPPVEALNPFFLTDKGLYGATDADNNCYIAYTMAAKKWTTQPVVDANTGFPTAAGAYDCDVWDFAGVDAAITALHPTGFPNPGYREKNKRTNQPTTTPTIHIPDTIGYGITKSNGLWQLLQDGGERCTTWAYMADAIRKTMQSVNGHANNTSSLHGNFAGLTETSTSRNEAIGRVVTLGHDTGLLEQINFMKMDYIDFRIYEAPAAIACFHESAQIATLKGPVCAKYLKIGDMVKTHLHGYRRIKRILVGEVENGESSSPTDTLFKHKEAELMLTGGHGVLVDELSEFEAAEQKRMGFAEAVDGKHVALVCFHADFKPAGPGRYTYYNFVLENDGDPARRFGVFANHVLCETPSEAYFEILKKRIIFRSTSV